VEDDNICGTIIEIEESKYLYILIQIQRSLHIFLKLATLPLVLHLIYLLFIHIDLLLLIIYRICSHIHLFQNSQVIILPCKILGGISNLNLLLKRDLQDGNYMTLSIKLISLLYLFPLTTYNIKNLLIYIQLFLLIIFS